MGKGPTSTGCRGWQTRDVPIELNHTIVAALDAATSAAWFAELFGLGPPERFGHFWQISTANGVSLDFASSGDREITPQHYAFLISEAEFDAIYGRVTERGLDHWADPMQRQPGEINHRDGGRGVYFLSNDGHFLEIITRPYGSGG
jgi:hypothetical protein